MCVSLRWVECQMRDAQHDNNADCRTGLPRGTYIGDWVPHGYHTQQNVAIQSRVSPTSSLRRTDVVAIALYDAVVSELLSFFISVRPIVCAVHRIIGGTENFHPCFIFFFFSCASEYATWLRRALRYLVSRILIQFGHLTITAGEI